MRLVVEDYLRQRQQKVRLLNNDNKGKQKHLSRANIRAKSLVKVSDGKNSFLFNRFHSAICILTKQFHSGLTRSRTKDSYTNESELELRIPIWFNPI